MSAPSRAAEPFLGSFDMVPISFMGHPVAYHFVPAGGRMTGPGAGTGASASTDELRRTIERYNDAWNAHDLDAIVALHAPGMVFENHTAGERAEGEAARGHIASIFENWPDIAFRLRKLQARDGLVVNEWTATATEQKTGRRLEWDGVDIFEFDGLLIKRKGVYSGSARPRVVES